MNPMKNVPKVQMTSPILSGILYAAIWLSIGALILSALLRWGSMHENALPAYSLIVHGLAALAGGFIAGKRSGQRGWYYGCLLGFAYGIIVLLISFLANNSGMSGRTLIMLGETLLAGGIGGMFGVNAKRN
ncbi:TIGR04086 family membrane protein [Paenibacillus oenotherae]|uniref:TIGR04086 family membrane protein n=1 Tax=Paenibacillus oenotherae TaxID=1435645 RepID=A0ABS7D8S3_9BACL|nr:TIGR04086 family membrane protein [Paenibacillus oenotherae]MBW7476246.1 TIGR04086 family membrane protein [Paenibacillus oenotherae]